MFDYEEARKEVMKGLDILNINGKNQSRKVLEYLECCPFIDVVAEHLGISVVDVYEKLRYYLSKETFEELKSDLKNRRGEWLVVYKTGLRRDLEIMDAMKNVGDEAENNGD